MSYLLDTCVISELVSKQPDPQVVAWVDALDDEQIFLSVITLGEIQKGIAKLSVSARQEQLLAWLHGELLARFQGHILPIDHEVMLLWGRLTADLERNGRKLPAIDALIAATALHNEVHLVTRNEADFQGTGVTIINPWAQLEHTAYPPT